MDVRVSEGVLLTGGGEPCNTSMMLPVAWAEEYCHISPLELMLFLTQHCNVEVLTPIASRAICRLSWTGLPSNLSNSATQLYLQCSHEGWYVYGMRGDPL